MPVRVKQKFIDKSGGHAKRGFVPHIYGARGMHTSWVLITFRFMRLVTARPSCLSMPPTINIWMLSSVIHASLTDGSSSSGTSSAAGRRLDAFSTQPPPSHSQALSF